MQCAHGYSWVLGVFAMGFPGCLSIVAGLPSLSPFAIAVMRPPEILMVLGVPKRHSDNASVIPSTTIAMRRGAVDDIHLIRDHELATNGV